MSGSSPSFPDLANSRYLLAAYARSSDGYEAFRATGDRGALVEVAGVLCGAWSVLADDDAFFAGVEWALDRGSGSAAQEEVDDVERYQDVDTLLSLELAVLSQAGLNPRHAIRLVTDLGTVLGDRLEPGRIMSAAVLRSYVADVAQDLCTAQKQLAGFDYDPASDHVADAPPHPKWLRHLRIAGKGVLATAGAAGAVANGIVAVTSFGVLSALGLSSVVAGAEAMSVVVEDIRRGSDGRHG